MILRLSNNNKLYLSFKFIENSTKSKDDISIKVDQTSMTVDESNPQAEDSNFLRDMSFGQLTIYTSLIVIIVVGVIIGICVWSKGKS